jgi:5-(carboxyamino)imidazole ribonucleotide mutase
MGSKSDLPVMQECADILGRFGVTAETLVMSAHRTPQKVHEFARSARDNGYDLIIAAAGMAAHLPGVIAAWTTLPVIGVPLAAGELRGVDSLYSIVQMPPGVPVACMGIGSPGARNAGYMAAGLLAMKYADVAEAWEEFRRKQMDGG